MQNDTQQETTAAQSAGEREALTLLVQRGLAYEVPVDPASLLDTDCCQ